MIASKRSAVGLALLLATGTVGAACDNGAAPPDASLGDATIADGPTDVAPAVDLAPPACGSGNRPLPKKLIELKWDNDRVGSTVREQTWKATIAGAGSFEPAKLPIHEAVRFDLKHPAKIYGFSVKWTNIAPGTDPKKELAAGLFRDFGYNGFDFWPADPLWEGTRCVEDVKDGQWIRYVFHKPVVIDHPGLVYVAHRAETPADPVFPFDTGMGKGAKCRAFSDCHSSVNMPTAAAPPKGIFFNGVTLTIPFNFMVRLHLEYTRKVAPKDRLFQKQIAAGLPSARSGVAWGDFDNDGWDDLLLGRRLFRNNKGSFVEITRSSGIEALKLVAAGGVWADYDNDGCLDLFLFSNSPNKADTLLKGDCKGAFSNVTVKAGIVDPKTATACGKTLNALAPATAAAWIDLDADGFVDLYLANYICSRPSGGEAYFQDTVFHNKGDGSFEDWSKTHGFVVSALPSRGVAPIDHDGDGDVDLFVNNYRLKANQFYQNNGDGTVSESAKAAGLMGRASFVSGGYNYGHTIGAAWGDLDNDGDFDLIAANLAHPRFFSFSDRTQVLLNGGHGQYKELKGGWAKPYGNPNGLRYQETHSVPVLADFDLDGVLDLVITAVYPGRPTDFYWGKGDGSFRIDAYGAGITTTNGWAAAASDYDRDGDPDIFVTDLFRNEQKKTNRHWLQVRAIGGVNANWAALGATVRVTAGGKTRLRHVQGGSGKGCQDSQYLLFGLGSATTASRISVTYPGGKRVSFEGPFKVDQRIWVYEDGKAHPGWSPRP